MQLLKRSDLRATEVNLVPLNSSTVSLLCNLKFYHQGLTALVKTLCSSIILETQISLGGLRVKKSFPSLPEKRAPRNGFPKRGNSWGRRQGRPGRPGLSKEDRWRLHVWSQTVQGGKASEGLGSTARKSTQDKFLSCRTSYGQTPGTARGHRPACFQFTGRHPIMCHPTQSSQSFPGPNKRERVYSDCGPVSPGWAAGVGGQEAEKAV